MSLRTFYVATDLIYKKYLKIIAAQMKKKKKTKKNTGNNNKITKCDNKSLTKGMFSTFDA